MALFKTKQLIPDFSFQDKMQDDGYNALADGKSVVLAATPGAGKTNMAINIIDRWVDESGEKVLVLTHGQTVLRAQFYDRADKLKSEGKVSFSCGVLGDQADAEDKQVHVALPHYFQNGRKAQQYGLVVIDEAHHFTKAEMIQRILRQTKGAPVLYLTGSPSPFIKEGKLEILPMTVSELMDRNVLTDPFIELVQTSIPLKLEDFNDNEDVKNEVKFTKGQTMEAMDSAISKLMDKLSERMSSKIRDPKKYNEGIVSMARQTKVGKFLTSAELGKTMVICHDQAQARDVQSYFQGKGVQALLSTSDTDTDSAEIRRFQTEEDAKVLVVVNRAILGFDMPTLANVVDLSMSHNPDRIFQALCRVVRRGPNGEQKIFLKVTTKNMAPLTYVVMSFTVALSLPEYYTTYDGTWKAKNVPVIKEFKEKVEKKEPDESKKRGERQGSNSEVIDLPRLATFTDLAHRDGGAAESFAYTTFSEVKARVFGGQLSWGHWNEKVNREKMASQCKSRTDYAKRFGSAYNASKSFPEEMSEFEKKFKWEVAQLPNGHWKDKNNREEAASQCKSRSDYCKSFSAAYQHSLKCPGEVDEFHSKFKWEAIQLPNGHWQSKANRKEAASQCRGRADYAKRFVAAYRNSNFTAGELDEFFPKK